MRRAFRIGPPHGWVDLIRQIGLLALAIFAYQLTRGLADDVSTAQDAIRNARDLVAVERALGLYVEPHIQAWALGVPGLDDSLSWLYLNVQTTVTLGGLLWIYLRHNPHYYFVRNMFFASFMLACLMYVLVPTAPPRLMPPDFGFVDTVEQLSGPRRMLWDGFANPYAAVPSMHIAFSLMIGWSIASLARSRWARGFWWSYPAGILFVVVATGNHFWLDAVAGAAVAGLGAVLASLLARLGPAAWSWSSTEAKAAT